MGTQYVAGSDYQQYQKDFYNAIGASADVAPSITSGDVLIPALSGTTQGIAGATAVPSMALGHNYLINAYVQQKKFEWASYTTTGNPGKGQAVESGTTAVNTATKQIFDWTPQRYVL